MTSVEDTLSQINSVLGRSTDGPYSDYSCKTVSWDDVQRGTVGGQLSCWGSNITDTRLYAKDGRRLFTVRGDNWNERLGRVRSEELALVATDEDGGGGSSGLRPVTLRAVLTNISKYGGYANLNIDSIADETLDEQVSVRFQTTFLPVEEGEKTSLEFAPEAYNYNTMDDADPRNLVLLCTTQGLAIQQDGKGAKKLFHHVRDEHGEVKRYWLEAESSSHKVGGAQAESSEEKEDALKRGKATSAVIGTKAIGTRFNVLMTIQVPLKQKRKKVDSFFGLEDAQLVNYCCASAAFSDSECYEEEEEEKCCEDYAFDLFAEASPQPASDKKSRRKSKSGHKRAKTGTSSAARVSRGSEVSDGTAWKGITVEDPARHPSEHVTATLVMYYTCSGGVPSTEDVKAAIDDLEGLYPSVETSGKLGNETFNFMKSELTVKDAIDIQNKLSSQPPPKPTAPENADVFPSNDW